MFYDERTQTNTITIPLFRFCFLHHITFVYLLLSLMRGLTANGACLSSKATEEDHGGSMRVIAVSRSKISKSKLQDRNTPHLNFDVPFSSSLVSYSI